MAICAFANVSSSFSFALLFSVVHLAKCVSGLDLFRFLSVIVFWNIFWMDGNKLSEGHQTLAVAALIVAGICTRFFGICVCGISVEEKKKCISRVVSYAVHETMLVSFTLCRVAYSSRNFQCAARSFFAYFGNKWIHANCCVCDGCFFFSRGARFHAKKLRMSLLLLGCVSGSSTSLFFI